MQANFSGGSGSPLTIALPQAITYTVTNDTPSIGLVFVLQDVNAPLVGITGGLVSGSLSYRINGGAPTSPNRIGRLYNPAGSIDDDDLIFHFWPSAPGGNLNDVVVLSAGSLTTGFPVSGAAPPSGLYSTILTDGNWVQIDPVPEPSSLLAALAVPAAATLSRRRQPAWDDGA